MIEVVIRTTKPGEVREGLQVEELVFEEKRLGDGVTEFTLSTDDMPALLGGGKGRTPPTEPV